MALDHLDSTITALRTRLDVVLTRQYELEHVLAEIDQLDIERQAIERLLEVYTPQAAPSLAAPEEASFPHDPATPADALDPITEALLGVLDAQMPQSTPVVRRQVEARLGVSLSYNQIAGRLHRGEKHRLYRKRPEGWVLGRTTRTGDES